MKLFQNYAKKEVQEEKVNFSRGNTKKSVIKHTSSCWINPRISWVPFPLQYVYTVFAFDIYSEESWQTLALLPNKGIAEPRSEINIFIFNQPDMIKEEK